LANPTSCLHRRWSQDPYLWVEAEMRSGSATIGREHGSAPIRASASDGTDALIGAYFGTSFAETSKATMPGLSLRIAECLVIFTIYHNLFMFRLCKTKSHIIAQPGIPHDRMTPGVTDGLQSKGLWLHNARDQVESSLSLPAS
jgi:hypothetical protein